MRDRLWYSDCLLEKELGEIDGGVSFWPVEDPGLSSIDWLSITISELLEVVVLDVFLNFRNRSFTLYCSYWWGLSFSFACHILFLSESYFFFLSELFFAKQSLNFSAFTTVHCILLSWYDQQDFAWQEMWRTSIHLFKVRWNDHLVNYLALMYRYGINTNIFDLKFSRVQNFDHFI